MSNEKEIALSIPGIDHVSQLDFNARPTADVIKRRKNLGFFLSFKCEFVNALSYYAKTLNKEPLSWLSEPDKPCVVLIPDYKYNLVYRIDVQQFVQDYYTAKNSDKVVDRVSLALFVKALQSFKTRIEAAYYEALKELDFNGYYDPNTDAALNEEVHTINFTVWKQHNSYYVDDVVAYYPQDSNQAQKGLFFKAMKNIPADTPFSLSNFAPYQV